MKLNHLKVKLNHLKVKLNFECNNISNCWHIISYAGAVCSGKWEGYQIVLSNIIKYVSNIIKHCSNTVIKHYDYTLLILVGYYSQMPGDGLHTLWCFVESHISVLTTTVVHKGVLSAKFLWRCTGIILQLESVEIVSSIYHNLIEKF